MRMVRHNDVKHRLTSLLQRNGYDCYEEVQCLDGHGSIRKADIVAFKSGSNQAIIVDPTVRYETNEDVGRAVQIEKEDKYASCAHSLNEIFGSRYGPRQFRVYGLWIGSRGTISKEMVQFFTEFRLDKRELPVIAEEVLVHSIRMLHQHVNGQ